MNYRGCENLRWTGNPIEVISRLIIVPRRRYSASNTRNHSFNSASTTWSRSFGSSGRQRSSAQLMFIALKWRK